MTPTTTPTINGLRLVSPEEAGVYRHNRNGTTVDYVIMSGDKRRGFIYGGSEHNVSEYPGMLVPLPKPRTTRPYKRGEVKLGDKFRHRTTGSDNMVTRIDGCGVWLSESYQPYANLLKNYDRLTYNPDGSEVLGVAGVESD